MPHTANP